MTRLLTRPLTLLSVPAILLLGLAAANAHAQLVHAMPAANESVGSPQKIELHFSEAIEPRLSGVKVTNKAGAEVGLKTVATADAKGLVASPAAPMAPGVYTISWTAVSPSDAHKMTGNYTFTVK